MLENGYDLFLSSSSTNPLFNWELYHAEFCTNRWILGAFCFSTFWANWQHVSIVTIRLHCLKHSLSLILVALPSLHFLLIIKRFERFDEANSGLMLIVFKSFDVSMNAVLLSQKNECTECNLVIVHISTLHHQSNLYAIKKNWFDLVGCMD